MSEITLKTLRKEIVGTPLEVLYERSLDAGIGKQDESLEPLLKLGLFLINFGDSDVEKLGYSIILRISNLNKSYKPLFDCAAYFGFVPIGVVIDKFSSDISDIWGWNVGRDLWAIEKEQAFLDGKYLTKQQKKLRNDFGKTRGSSVVIAPTSYGKSEFLIKKIVEGHGLNRCVIVPTKALLAQTSRRIQKVLGGKKRVIVHPDMYRKKEQGIVAVLTQERLMRLFKKNEEIQFDELFIDEAHNLLGDEVRETILTFVLMIAKRRNSKTNVHFVTPFLAKKSNLVIPNYVDEFEEFRITEKIKNERFEVVDFTTGQRSNYDQYLNSFSGTRQTDYSSEAELVRNEGIDKNIIYLNRPKKIEKFAKELADKSDSVIEKQTLEGIKAISDLLSPDYYLIDCLRKGVAYHHGTMPEIIRLYVEETFRNFGEIKNIVTSSTLLEGVNLPAERLFVLNQKKGLSNLSRSQFQNLIGRVGRLKEIFDESNGRLDLLEPKIIVTKGVYSSSKLNLQNFVSKNANFSGKEVDQRDNVLLKEEALLSPDEKKKRKDQLEYLGNVEPRAVEMKGIKFAKTKSGRACFRNGINEFDILTFETKIHAVLGVIDEKAIRTPKEFLEIMNSAFLNEQIILSKIDEANLGRLRRIEARNYYEMMLEWRMSGSSYRKMIGNYIGYWTETMKEPKTVFVGRPWGEVNREGLKDKITNMYISVKDKTTKELINWAIHKTKLESDFIDNVLLKFVEVLNDLGLIEDGFYSHLKYGTSDLTKICLMRNGFSVELVNILLSGPYRKFLKVDLSEDLVAADAKIIEEMLQRGVNQVLVHEMKAYLGLV